MKVYILDADVNRYRPIYYVDENSVVEFSRSFNGTPIGNAWTGKEQFKFVPRRMPKGDTPGLDTDIPVFNPKAVEALADLLEGNGELLPISIGSERYFLFNVTQILDALDEPHCEVVRFDSGRIMDIIRYSFVEAKLAGAFVFRIPQDVGRVFVTEPFVERVKSAGLVGFKLPLVWSGE